MLCAAVKWMALTLSKGKKHTVRCVAFIQRSLSIPISITMPSSDVPSLGEAVWSY